jgi:4-hydroxy-tetrahydrodipicolinate synthase
MRARYTRRQLLAATTALFAVTPRSTAVPAKPMRGAFPIMATPYNEAKEIDFEDLAAEVGFLDRCGAHGMVWPQWGSEQQHLTKEEKLHGMEVLVNAAKGTRPALVIGVQDPDPEVAFEFAEHAEKLGPDALISMPPSRAKSVEDYRTFFRTMAKITKRPFFIQTSGGAKDVVPEIGLLVDLAEEFPNFGYIKAEYPPVIERVQTLIRNRPPIKSVMCGFNGRSFTYEMRLGTDGTCPFAHSADIFAQIWDLHDAGEDRKALDLYSKLLLVLNVESVIQGTRQYLMKRRGVFKTMVSRDRDVQLSPVEIEEIEANLAMLKPYLRT